MQDLHPKPAVYALLDCDAFDVTSIDSMHAVCEGIFKLMFEKWYNQGTKKPYATGNKGKATLDKVLIAIKPCSTITRKPRLTAASGQWKASEWRNFGFMYSLSAMKALVEENLIDKIYYDHWIKLVACLAHLNSERIKIDFLDDIRDSIDTFLLDAVSLYGEELFSSSNFHLLCHLVDDVSTLGPLWRTSMFKHESYNQVG